MPRNWLRASGIGDDYEYSYQFLYVEHGSTADRIIDLTAGKVSSKRDESGPDHFGGHTRDRRSGI